MQLPQIGRVQTPEPRITWKIIRPFDGYILEWDFLIVAWELVIDAISWSQIYNWVHLYERTLTCYIIWNVAEHSKWKCYIWSGGRGTLWRQIRELLCDYYANVTMYQMCPMLMNYKSFSFLGSPHSLWGSFTFTNEKGWIVHLIQHTSLVTVATLLRIEHKTKLVEDKTRK